MNKQILVIGFIILLAAPVFAQSAGAPAQEKQEVREVIIEADVYNDLLALKAEIEELKVLVSELKNEITNKRMELIYLQDSVVSTTKSLNDLLQQKAGLQENINKTSLTLANLSRQKNETQIEVDVVTQALAALNDQRGQLQKDVDSTTQILTDLTRQKETMLVEIAKIKDQKNELENNPPVLAVAPQNTKEAKETKAAAPKAAESKTIQVAQQKEPASQSAPEVIASAEEVKVDEDKVKNEELAAVPEPLPASAPDSVSESAPALAAAPKAAVNTPKPKENKAPSVLNNTEKVDNLLNIIHFKPDSTVLTAGVGAALDEIGVKMLMNPAMKIRVRGYSAPAGTLKGQIMISEVRAKKTAEYLKKNFGIPDDRIEVKWVGARERPLSASSSDLTQLRAVEVFAI